MKTLNRVRNQGSTEPQAEQVSTSRKIQSSLREMDFSETAEKRLRDMESLSERDKPEELELILLQEKLEKAFDLPLDQASAALEGLYLVIKEHPRLRIVAESLKRLIEAEYFLNHLATRVSRF